MRDTIADYLVVGPWGPSTNRYVCRPPERLDRPGQVLVTEVPAAAGDPGDVLDRVARLAAIPGGGMIGLIEAGPDRQTGGAYVVTEPAAGGTLAVPSGPCDAGSRRRAVAAAARALHALHEAGLAHGTVRPASVLLGEGGAVLDLPRLEAPGGEVVRVGSWRDLVTVDPELLAGEVPSRSSDIWALGATLHAVLSERPLYPGIEGDEPVTAVQRVMFTRPEPDPALDPGVRPLVEACLAADPAERPETTLAVAERLEALEVTP